MIDILIIDDEPEIKAYLFQKLSKETHSIVIAINKEEAVEQLSNHSFDEIMLDYSLGYELTGMDIIPHIQASSLKENGVVVPNSFNPRYKYDLMVELDKQEIPNRMYSMHEPEKF